MTEDCPEPVTHHRKEGYAYCAEHGLEAGAVPDSTLTWRSTPATDGNEWWTVEDGQFHGFIFDPTGGDHVAWQVSTFVAARNGDDAIEAEGTCRTLALAKAEVEEFILSQLTPPDKDALRSARQALLAVVADLS